jgi:hypothetical protein
VTEYRSDHLDPDSRICRICREVLDIRTIAAFGVTTYIHAGARTLDHEPDPALPGEVEARTFCDFCYEPEPGWVVPARDFLMPTPDGSHYGSKGDWSSCETCAVFVREDRWDALFTRVLRSWERRRGSMDQVTGEYLQQLHAGLRENITGTPEKLAP